MPCRQGNERRTPLARFHSRCRVLAWVALFGCGMSVGPGPAGYAAEPVLFDFRQRSEALSWHAQHGISGMSPTPEGLVVRVGGEDPYLEGPVRDFPEAQLLWLNLSLQSEVGGMAQLFFYPAGNAPTEDRSVRFPVRGGERQTIRVPCPAFGPRYRLRFDPPGAEGVCLVERIWFEERVLYAPPDWPPPGAPGVEPGDPEVTSGGLRLTHAASRFGAFELSVAGQRVAVGRTRGWVGYAGTDGPRWFSMPDQAVPDVADQGPGMAFVARTQDPDGALWTMHEQFRPAAGRPGSILVEARLTVSRPRRILHWPAFTLLAGVGLPAAGSGKEQALLAGVEYLDDEPSSSEADLTGAQAHRQVVDTTRLTFPLAAVSAGGRYVALSWEMDRDVAVVFDSPDRLFRSGGHLMGLVVPGSDGSNRDEGSLVPYEGRLLEPGSSLQVRAWVMGGVGTGVMPAVQQYVRAVGLPAVPSTGHDLASYARLAARGWLESGLGESGLFRHAVVGAFQPGPAADAACFLDFLAPRVTDAGLSRRLQDESAQALARVPVREWFASGVGHIRAPLAPLVFGAVAENQAAAVARGRSILGRFTADGVFPYVPRPGGLDYGRTHWTNEANGFTAEAVASVLADAAFSGDAPLRLAGLHHLRAMQARFPKGVPRGAQTWEVPLHTPDILASANLVRAYTLGYQLSGDREFLEAAEDWAWTGVPFVYLRAPVEGPIGVYATTPVLGATQWIAPNWIGLPVQWCGLVYADALYRLADLGVSGPWRQLADGITASGVCQSYPESHPRWPGLLPDSFVLKGQLRSPANINPGTLQACAARLFGAGPMHDLRWFGNLRSWVMSAGGIHPVRQTDDGAVFRVEAWRAGPHQVLMMGDVEALQARVLEPEGGAWLGPGPGSGTLIVPAHGRVTVEVRRH